MKLLNAYYSLFAKQNALKSAFSVILAMSFALLLGFHDGGDFAWFAPFSVLITLLSIPDNINKYQIIFQRSTGMLLGCILALFGAIIFKNSPDGLIIYAFSLTFLFNYAIGKHHPYRYCFFLTFLFLDLLLCFAYMTPVHFYSAILHFPFLIIIAMFSLIGAEILTPRNTIKNKMPKMLQQSYLLIREHLSDIAFHQIDLQWFSYVEQQLQIVRSQLSQEKFSQYYNTCINLKMIAIRLNYIAKHLAESEAACTTFLPELKNITRLLDIALKKAADAQPVDLQSIQEVLNLLTQRFNLSDLKDEHAFKVVLHELNGITQPLIGLQKNTLSITRKKLPFNKKFNLSAFLFALQVTFAMSLSVFIIALLKLNESYQTYIIAITLSASILSGRLLYKFSLRITCLFFTSVIAFFLGLLLKQVDSIILTTSTIALFTYFAIWWTFKYDRLSSAGTQSALIFVLLLLANSGPHLHIMINLHKVELIMLAACIALLINLIITPKLPSHNIDKRIQNILKNINSYLKTLPEQKDKTKAMKALNLINTQINDLQQIAISLYFSLRKRKHVTTTLNRLMIISNQLQQLHMLIYQEQQTLQFYIPILKQLENINSNKKEILRELEQIDTSNASYQSSNIITLCLNIIIQELSLLVTNSRKHKKF